MAENKQPSIELDLSTTTGIDHRCSECGQVGCGHSTTTSDVTDDAERKTRKKAQELPPELKEFAQNYEVLGLVGEGGMSAVYKAQHRALNRPVAIKMLHSHLVRDFIQRKRFEQEAQALFMLEHSNIVKIRDFGSTTNGKPYLIMDFLHGKSLSDVLKNEGPMPVQRALRVFLQVCDALQHAHGKAIIHRDIKPSNIVLVDEDSVRIVDFGIAKFNQDEINPGLTQTGDVFGSPLYMSPEQCLGHKLDHRSDIYALGCVMYETLSGHPPLVGETALATIHKHTSEMPKPLQVSNCDTRLRGRLDEIIFKTLEKDPDKRYQSMQELQKDLQELLADTGYRKATGYYVRYARANRRIVNSIKKHSIIFAAVCMMVTALVSIAGCMFIDHSSSMLKPPQTLNAELNWNWLTRPTEPIPLDFLDKLRQARFIVSNAANRLGNRDDRVKQMRRKLAEQVLRYGFWEEAVEHLTEARAGYGADDPNIADIDQLMGDLYAQKNEWKEAVSAYGRAMQRYYSMFTSADNSRYIAKLKYAWTLHRTGQTTKARSHFDEMARLRVEPTAFELTMGRSGLADCDLAIAEAETKDWTKRGELLEAARGNYKLALPGWNQWSRHDSNLCLIRIADTYILQQRWHEASQAYGEALTNSTVFTSAELAGIERNYSRLLFRDWKPLEAMRMDDEAKETAKRAASQENERNTIHRLPDSINF